MVRSQSGWMWLAATLPLLVITTATAQTSFVAFESGPVRPVALSPDGSTLLAVNTPDNRLEVFDVVGGSLTHTDSIPVGMEPVAVAARTNTEIWVVNHLSDSVSIVDLSASPPQVTRTLLVGDEPRDIVFAGSGGDRAFISTAHRGQHRTHSSISGVTGAGDPQLTTEGIGRADVWVFDATSLGATIGGTPVEILTFFADSPRALAASADGNTVYVAAFHSGNQTTIVNELDVADGFGGTGAPGPAENIGVCQGGPDDGDPCINSGQCGGGGTCEGTDTAPEVGAIVKLIGGNWLDADGVNRNSVININLPDHDVFSINANTLAGGSVVEFDSVGTILFNMAVNPINGNVYVTNTDLENERLFEGPGDHGGSTVQGQLSKSRITVIDPSGPTISPKHLNQHINYSDLHTDPGANHAAINAQIPHSLATPLQPVVSSDGNTIYMAAFGSAKIGVFDTSDIEDPNFGVNFDPTVESANYIDTGGGPGGLALDEANNRLYVSTRFDNSVAVIDLGTNATLETHALHNPEPQSVVDGRPHLYDAVATSGNGEASCSSCHIFGDLDSLAWNLGDPDASLSTNNQPQPDPLLELADPTGPFHPMKGPMTTQTLRGLATHGGMHWRGDRVDGFFGTDPCTEPGYAQANSTNAPCDEDFAFRNFIVAFEGLVGKEGTISGADMQEFSDFMLQVMLPPNPVRNLDNSLTSAQQDGEDLWFNCGPGTTECAPLDGNASDTVEDCDGCHSLDPLNGFFGTGGEQSFEGEPQHAKVPHLRNVYSKIGLFAGTQNGGFLGDQIRGFSVLHDGSVGTVKNFLEAAVFTINNAEELDLEQFVLAFPSDLAPIVGQQVTLTSTNSGVVDPRIDLMIARAAASFDSFMLGGTVTECDLVVKGSVGGVERGWVRESGGLFRDDTNNTITDAALRNLANTEGPLTYTCAPPGSGERMGIDRDDDSTFDALDNCPMTAGPQDNFDGDSEGDICDADDDNDGLDDIVETNTGTYVSPSDTGTNPLDIDTDGDGWEDGFEVLAGTDPTDPTSTPAPSAKVPALPLAGLGLLVLGLGAAAWPTLRRRRLGGKA